MRLLLGYPFLPNAIPVLYFFSSKNSEFKIEICQIRDGFLLMKGLAYISSTLNERI